MGERMPVDVIISVCGRYGDRLDAELLLVPFNHGAAEHFPRDQRSPVSDSVRDDVCAREQESDDVPLFLFLCADECSFAGNAFDQLFFFKNPEGVPESVAGDIETVRKFLLRRHTASRSGDSA